MNIEQRSKSSESKTKSRKLSSGNDRSAVELAEDVEHGDEADEAEAHDEHDSWRDLQARSVVGVGGLPFSAMLSKRYDSSQLFCS